MKLLSLLLLLAFGSVNAQSTLSLSGQVRDKATGDPLPYATIQLVGTSLGTTTNQTGEFVFRVPATALNPVVAFSYVGYQSVEFDWHNRDQPPLTVTLEPKSTNLKEVVVRPVDPLQIITRSLEKWADNYASAPYQAEGFQREYVTANRDVIQLLEVTFRSLGSNRSQVTTVLDGRYLEDKEAKAPLWNPSKGGFYTLGWTSVSGIEAPDPKAFLGVELKKAGDLTRYYTFAFRKMSTLDAKEVYVIDFDQRKGVRKPLLKGTLYIEAETAAIVKVEHQVSPHGLPFLKPHHSWGGSKISQGWKRLSVRQDQWTTTYKQLGRKWYLGSLVIDTHFSAALVLMGMVQGRQDSLRLHSERMVTRIDTTPVLAGGVTTNISDVGRIPTLQNFIKKEYENQEATWADVNFIPSDTALADLASRLRRKNEQWERDRRKRVAQKALASRAFTARQLSEDLTYLQESLERIHPGIHWYTDQSRLDRSFALLQSKLAKTTSEAAFLGQLGPLIEQIHCGHTRLHPSEASREYQSLFTKAFPLELWIRGDTAVTLTDDGGVARGSTVLSINGHDLPEAIRRIRSAIASDGFNQTYKTFRLQQDFPALFAWYVQAADTFEIKSRDRSGQIHTVRLEGREPAPVAGDFATAQIHDSLRTLVLKIPSFATHQDFPGFLNETFDEIARREITNLVIDLRNNQGGRDEYGALLFAYLTDQPFRYYRRLSVATTDSTLLNRLSVGEVPLLKALPGYLAGIQETQGGYAYTDHPNLSRQTPRSNGFRGTVYLLINGGTFSAAAELAATVRSHRRGIFIGEEAGGGYYGNSSLATPTLTLPHSRIRVEIPLARYELAVSPGQAVGHGVLADHPVSSQWEDRGLNRDRALEYCFELIRKTKN